MNKSAKTRLTTMLAMGALLACLHGVPNALADESVRQQKVRFQDLNLDSDAGVQTLYTRIHAAAKQVCAQTDPVMREAISGCMAKAEQDAIAKVNRSQLTAFYRQKSKTGTTLPKLIASR